jgi:hypothetical protein
MEDLLTFLQGPAPGLCPDPYYIDVAPKRR